MDPTQNIPSQAQMPPAPPAAPPAPSAPQPPTPTPPPANATPPAASRFNGKIILLIAVGILLLTILGAVYFMAQQLNSQQQEPTIPTPTQVPSPTLTPTPTPLSEQDIDNIDLGDPETNLKNIEDDVKQL